MHKWMKRGIGIMLAGTMAAALLSETQLYAQTAQSLPQKQTISLQKEEMIKAAKRPEEEEMSALFLRNKGEASKYGYQDIELVDRDGKEVAPEFSEEASAAYGSKTTFPVSYSMVDLGEMPPVRNQGRWGTCWAHAALCSIESNMMKQRLADAKDADYSERHLSYFAHRRNNTLQDGEDSYDDTYGWYGGGNYYSAFAVLGGWYGAAAESDYPYAAYEDMEDLDESQRSASVCHLTDVDVLYTPEEVKNAVMETGAVMCSYHSGDGTFGTAEMNVYHASAEGRPIDHSVSIVGWNDDYPKAKFDDAGRSPAEDGAWLCRNSWGADWAEDGYFWISYEDATLGYFCSFQGDTAENYDNIRQYDGASGNLFLESEKAANLFSAESAEELKAVSFYAYGKYDYKIEIYAEGMEEMNVPSDGALVYVQKGTLAHPGYHVIPLEDGVLLGSGMKYAVSVELTENDGRRGFSYVESGDNYSSKDGQSFLYSNGVWTDTKADQEFNIKNVCIKAFTDNAEPIEKSRIIRKLEEIEQENLLEDDYTAGSWAEFIAKKNAAMEVYQSENPSEREIANAVVLLMAARNALREAVVLIEDENAFETFAKDVTSGNSYEGQIVRLLCDLDMTGIVHKAVGDANSQFQGVFDGGGHFVSGLSYQYEYSFGGLFGYIGKNGMVKDLKLLNPDIELGAYYSGTIVGMNEGTVSGCEVTGENLRFISSGTGGIAGMNEGTISDCMVKGTLIFACKDGITGGITGINSGTVERCFISGKIYADDAAAVGGIIGYSYEGSFVRMCYNLASIDGESNSAAKTAGIGVYLYGSTDSCYNYGEIRRTGGDLYGAIYGSLGNGTISNCYYLNSSCEAGGCSPALSKGSLTEKDFASGKAAWYLNSNGGTGKNTCKWSQKDGLPVWANQENKAVIKVTVSQESGNLSGGLLNEIVSGEFYEKAGTKVKARISDNVGIKLENILFEVKGLECLDKEKLEYILPNCDVKAVVVCKAIAENEKKDFLQLKKGAEEIIGAGRYQVLDAKKKIAAFVEAVNKDAATLDIPATVKICGVTCKVTQIKDKSAKNLKRLKKLIIGKNVTVIGKQAFFGCKKLRTVEIKGKALKTVKGKAFQKTAANMSVRAKKMSRSGKAVLLKKLKRAGMSRKAKIK